MTDHIPCTAGTYADTRSYVLFTGGGGGVLLIIDTDPSSGHMRTM